MASSPGAKSSPFATQALAGSGGGSVHAKDRWLGTSRELCSLRLCLLAYLLCSAWGLG